MPCPWYDGGYCTSPKLDKPSNEVVVPERCLGGTSYKTCSLYVELTSTTKKGIEEFASIDSDKIKELKPYPLLHYLNYAPKSGCEYFIVYEHTGYYLAYCKVLKRLLARHEIKNCEMFNNTCPLRRYALTMLRKLK